MMYNCYFQPGSITFLASEIKPRCVSYFLLYVIFLSQGLMKSGIGDVQQDNKGFKILDFMGEKPFLNFCILFQACLIFYAKKANNFYFQNQYVSELYILHFYFEPFQNVLQTIPCNVVSHLLIVIQVFRLSTVEIKYSNLIKII